MSQYFEACVVPETAAGAVAKHLRVKTPGAVALAGALDPSIGTMESDCLAAGPCSVRIKTTTGTKKMVAAAAITAGVYVYGAASGKISAVANGNVAGIAREAATADGDVIEVMPINGIVQNLVTAYAANGALAVAPGTAMLTKAGVNAMTLAAPTVAQEGLILNIVSQTANAHTVTATGLLDDGVTGGAKNLATFAAFAGASLTLMASNLKWAVVSLKAVTIS
tara:strand:- start:772 stop:1440 length:669 start_codon:yes stop_codon:yes gene_type:complete